MGEEDKEDSERVRSGQGIVLFVFRIVACCIFVSTSGGGEVSECTMIADLDIGTTNRT